MSLAENQLRDWIMASVAERAAINGGFVSRAELEAVLLPTGETRRVIDASRGIWNPRDLSATLSVVSSPSGPYDDREVQGGMFHYSYRAGSIDGDNRKLREAHRLGIPIILLRKIAVAVYVPIMPVYVVADDVQNREFVLALDESVRFMSNPLDPTPAERRYAERVVRQRLHQPEFRGRVIRAYDQRCTVCRLQHPDLLEAAHIIGDREDGGDPVVPNGLSLCKIHHAAYDRNLLGVSPDYTVHIHPRLLDETDGPMLLHGLQQMHGKALTVPRRAAERPDRDRLDTRFRAFEQALGAS